MDDLSNFVWSDPKEACTGPRRKTCCDGLNSSNAWDVAVSEKASRFNNRGDEVGERRAKSQSMVCRDHFALIERHMLEDDADNLLLTF